MGEAGVTYAYAPDGLRASKTAGNAVTLFVYDNANIIEEICGSDVNKYYRGIGIVKNSDNLYYLYDGLGDVVMLFNSGGPVAASYEYDAYGNTEQDGTAPYNPFGYKGEYFDTETGFVYLRARYYDPSTGRFINEDPIRDGNNWYVYANNNPIRYIDPWGLAEYSIGAAIPTFVHDEGFLFDPKAVWTDEDMRSFRKWKALAFASRFAPWLKDASKMYNHYLDNTGTDQQIDYERAYKEDGIIKQYIDGEMNIMKKTVELLYNDQIGDSFEIIGTLQAIPNGTSENWQKTIGAHYVYGKGEVTINSHTGEATMKVTFTMEDMYNFNPGQADIATGTKDAVNGRFAELGWAKEFKTYGSLTRTITWQLNSTTEQQKNGGNKR